MENQQELPTIELVSEDKKLKITYLGGDNLFLSDEINTIAIHLGNIEFLELSLKNL